MLWFCEPLPTLFCTMERLPLEVLSLVTDRLSPRDQVACLSVCHCWRDAFMKIIYTNVKLGSKLGATSFFQLLREHNAISLGSYVSELEISADDIRAWDVQELRHLCPRIRTLVFRAYSCADISCKHTTQMFEIPKAILSKADITNLKLISVIDWLHWCDCSTSESTMSHGIEPDHQEPQGNKLIKRPSQSSGLLSFLDNAESLRCLTITNVLPKPFTFYLDYIFAKCPRLSQLHIEIMDNCYGFDNLEYGLNTLYNVVEQGRRSDSETRLVPVTLEYLFFQDGSGDLCQSYPFWLQYFACQTSNIKSLRLGTACEGGITYIESFFSKETMDNIVHTFCKNCPRLETLCLAKLDMNYAHTSKTCRC